jgi:hypothetical protein
MKEQDRPLRSVTRASIKSFTTVGNNNTYVPVELWIRMQASYKAIIDSPVPYPTAHSLQYA